MKRITWGTALMLMAGMLSLSVTNAQSLTKEEQVWKIVFPDIPGYQTLICDFHLHTVFSDGSVWPAFRVHEAIRDGLDAISITEHLEFQPKEEDVPHTNKNRPYEIALEAAGGTDLIVINGIEITRPFPPGQANALFLKDANELVREDAFEVFREAKRQGAFIFWNYPTWLERSDDGSVELTDMHSQLLDEGLTHGVEIVDRDFFYEEAFQVALERDLTLIGNSGEHSLVEWTYNIPEGEHRPVTLVFAEEKTEESLKEALEQGRTVVWYKNKLFGRSEYLVPLIKSSLKVERQPEAYLATVFVENRSDADLLLENLSDYPFHNQARLITVKAHETTMIQVRIDRESSNYDLRFRVLNAFTGPDKQPEITIEIR